MRRVYMHLKTTEICHWCPRKKFDDREIALGQGISDRVHPIESGMGKALSEFSGGYRLLSSPSFRPPRSQVLSVKACFEAKG
jgi:hypothetical protein